VTDVRRRVGVLLGVIAVLAVTLGGLARVRLETGVASFLPASDPALAQYSTLAESFGGDPIVVLLHTDAPWGLLQRDALPALLGTEGALAQLPDVAGVYGPATTLNQLAAQSQRLLAELTGRRDGLRTFAENAARAAGTPPAAVTAAGDAAVAGFDARYGPLIVAGLPVGLPTLRNQKFVDSVVQNGAGESRPRFRYVVPGPHDVAVLVRPRDDLSQDATERLVTAVRQAVDDAHLPVSAVTVSGVPTIVAALGGAVWTEIPLVGGAAVAVVALLLFLVPWEPRRRRRLLPLAVSLAATALTLAVLGWIGHPLSLGVLAFLPVVLGLGSYYPTYVARGAAPRTICVVAGGTAAGFATLALSPLPFVRDLGTTLAIGIAFSVALALLAPTPPRVVRPGRASVALRPVSRPRIVAVAAGIVALAGWALLPLLPLQTGIDDLTAGLPAVADATHVEDVVGSGGELSIVLEGPDVLTPEAWAWMDQAQQTVVTKHGDEARPALSAPALLGFLGATPTAAQITAGVRLLPPYLTSAVLRPDGKVGVLSFGVKLDDLAKLRALIGSVAAELPPAPPGYRTSVSGLPAVAARGYELVSADRWFAGLAGLVAAGTVLALGLRQRSDAGRAVAAAVLATGTELLLLWLFGIPLNPLTVALGSLTAAVGCEFTVMLCDAARSRDRSLRVAVLLATLTSGAGFAVLALSGLAVMREFGLLLALSVVLSALAARLVVALAPPPVTSVPDRDPAPRSLVGAS
jgi:uncharacterized protein